MTLVLQSREDCANDRGSESNPLSMIAGHLRVEPTVSGLYDRTVHLAWIQDERVVREVNIT